MRDYENSEYAFNFRTAIEIPDKMKSDTKPECFSVKFEKLDKQLAAGIYFFDLKAYSNGYIAVFNLENILDNRQTDLNLTSSISGNLETSFNKTKTLNSNLSSYSYFDNSNNSKYKLMRNGDFPITCLRWKPHNETTPKNILVSVSADCKIIHWHTATGKALHIMEEKDNPLMCLDFNKTGQYFATAGNDKTVRIYDDNTKTLLKTMRSGDFKLPGHSNRIFALHFHKENPNLLMSGGWDNTIQFYDLREGVVINSLYGPHVCGDSIDTKENVMLTGSWAIEKQIQLWDIRMFKLMQSVEWDNKSYNLSPKKISFKEKTLEYNDDNNQEDVEEIKTEFNEIDLNKKIENNIQKSYASPKKNKNDEMYNTKKHSGSVYVYSVQFNKNLDKYNMFGIGGSNTNIFRIFDNSMEQKLPIATSHELPKSCYTIDYSNEGKLFAYGCGDGIIRLLEINKK